MGHALVDWVADYREQIERFPVMSPVRPGEIRRQLPISPPAQGSSLDDLFPELGRVVLPGITHWNHPRFFAYFPSNTTYASILADLVISGLGAQGMSWQTSPAATEVEEVMMDWLRQMIDLPSTFTGVIQDTASSATLCALLCARERTSGHAQVHQGLQSGAPPLVVYASDQAHSSIEKDTLLAGFGRDYLRLIPTDDEHALRADLLESAIEKDKLAGRRPCAIVAAIGTTGTTAVDPLRKIVEIAKANELWLHVDAAMAGTAMILPECRWMWEGIEGADSVVLNPHKWMGVGFDFSAYYVRDPQHLIRVMSTNPSYLRTAQDGEVKNFRDWHIPLGRRFRALKFWFLLFEQGVEGLQSRLRRDLALAQWFKEQIDAAPDWERLAPVPLQTICIRHRPQHLTNEEDIAAHNRELVRRVNEAGRVYLTPSVLKGKQMIRVSIGAETTEKHHVEELWNQLRLASQS
ncbi:MAG TPA: pyridoxal-dependent decarboxylase [Polyangium sp.]|nr:pyridoxal-dependent decarboxylase [Polyangium sp.]